MVIICCFDVNQKMKIFCARIQRPFLVPSTLYENRSLTDKPSDNQGWRRRQSIRTNLVTELAVEFFNDFYRIDDRGLLLLGVAVLWD